MKADRSNELESLLKELDAKRAELKAQEREILLERHKMEQERLRYQEDKLLWRKEIDGCEDRLRKKDAEIAKIQVLHPHSISQSIVNLLIIQSDTLYEIQSKYKHEKEDLSTLHREREKEDRLRRTSKVRHIESESFLLFCRNSLMNLKRKKMTRVQIKILQELKRIKIVIQTELIPRYSPDVQFSDLA
jgi:hypothetical protein